MMAPAPFEALRAHYYGAILADPPWRFRTYSEKGRSRAPDRKPFKGAAALHYDTMAIEDIRALPVGSLAADDCALFLWATWPFLFDALSVLPAWKFKYTTCAFAWTKAHAGQIEMFRDDFDGQVGLGYWTRSNTEFCLLATRGEPKRLNADVRQAIIEPRREHSRKPDCVYGRIERLVAGPYIDLFARQRRTGWNCWGDQVPSEGAQ
jgi:N6-adenosine-specific RNA methylase IME4